ncbi:autotransporter outer membrane beta-barrel domain-containing protein [Ereboglobus sp. PH5-10]|uniref:autotransporter outer membrane beta-barrel domain-containing protein n=1 Tax=Ereboglobus sp. PH5-10 TaxID=2940629 RepID=UPI002405204D|nr:autotransporter outer membrane beta-barrel domain-containing protein [Ereboglobus sp. PH5-10]
MQNQNQGKARRSICVRKRNILIALPLLAALAQPMPGQVNPIPSGTALNSFALNGGTYSLSGTLVTTDVGSAGIWFASASDLIIESGGYTRGGNAGVNMAGGSTLTNAGVISGTKSDANGAYGRGAVTITNKSTGVISGTSRGIHVDNGAAIITNDAGGLIQGGYRGIQLNAGGEITNSGSIVGKSNHGIETNYVSVLVTNSTSGLIQGNTDGLHMGAGGTAANHGTISGRDRGLYAGNIAKVTNETGATIQGRSNGVVLNKGGEVDNRGTISGTTDYAVRINSGEGRVTNYEGATINGGVYAGGTTAVINNGNISGNRGVYLSSNSTLSGTGAIDVTGTALIAENGVSHTNGADNLLRGGVTGAHFLSGGTLTNSGTVIGTSGNGVLMAGAGKLTNNALVQGGATGAAINGGGTVSNSGTIKGASNVGLSVAGLPATVTNAQDALIQGGQNGMMLYAGGTLTNSGTVIGDGNIGVYAGGSVLITNTNNALIQGGNRGISLNGSGTVRNSGTIKGTGDTGIYAIGVATIDNAENALVQGGTHGIVLATGGTVTNSGTIKGDGGWGVQIGGGEGRVTNNAGGAIIGGIFAGGTTQVKNDGAITGANGVYLSANSTLSGTGIIDVAGIGLTLANGGAHTNNGLIKSGTTGVVFEGSGSLGNTGTIQSAGVGVSAVGVVTITNGADGLITSDVTAVSLSAGGTVANSGTIIGGIDYNHGIYSGGLVTVTNDSGALIQGPDSGIYLGVGGTVSNAGTITGVNGQGIYANGIVEVDNAAGGLMQGYWHGVRLDAGGTIVNSGSVIGDVGHGIEANYQAVFVSNTDTGLIQSNGKGVSLGAGGTVANSGTIISTGQHGIYAAIGAEATISNTTGGLVQGGIIGVELAGGGTIANSGTIAGGASGWGVQVATGETIVTNADTGVIVEGVYAGGTTQVTNDGRITGALGVYLGANSTLSGTGTIDVTDTALILANGATHTNAAEAFIQGGTTGVRFEGTGSLGNSGTIIGVVGQGIDAVGSAAITNATGALIQGGHHGVQLGSGGTIANSGTIIAQNAHGVISWNNATLVTNTTGALIRGNQHGVELVAGGTVTNSGTIVGVTQDGLMAGGPAEITNATNALIQGSGHGIRLDAGGAVTNSGTVLGQSGHGIEANYQAVLVSNTGIVQGAASGVSLGAGGAVANTGTIIGDSAHGILSWNNATLVTNAAAALVQGNQYGVELVNGGTVTNSGTIIGENDWGVKVNDGAALVANNAGATINNGIYAGGSVEITNDGLVGGNKGVYLSASSTLSGTGTIDVSGVALELADGATHTNNSTMLLKGGEIGVQFHGSGSLGNSGTIIGDSSTGGGIGIYANNNAATIIVTNEAAGLVRGADSGIVTYNSGTITNSGTVIGETGNGIRGGSSPVTITNTTAGALIQGHDFGIYMDAGAIYNSGTIIGTDNNGIQTATADIAVTNDTAGIIQGVNFGIYMNGGTLANSGTIIATDNVGAQSSESVHITNAGLIEGIAIGLYLEKGGTISNTGIITGGTGYGVGVGSGVAEITNNATGIINEGVFAGGTTQLINDGAILGHYGVYLAAASTLTGTGYVNVTGTALIAEDGVAHTNDTMNLLHGDIVGVHFLGSGTLTNSGTIEGAGDTGVYAAGQALVTNTTGGIITGPVYAINLAANAANEVRLWNSSTLAGNLGIAGTNSQLTLISNDTLNAQRHADAVTGSTEFTGTLVKQGAGTWIIDIDPGAGMEQAATLVQSGTLVVDWDAHQLNAANNAEIGIDAGATLQVSTTSSATTTLTNPLAGAGYVDLHSTATDPGATFSLQPFSPSALPFTGTVGVRGDSQLTYFRFDDDAENALADATLRLGQNSETTLDKDRAIGGFDLFSGVFFVNASTTGTTVEPHTLTVTGTLHGTSGTIGVHTDVLGGLDLPKPPGTGGLTGHIFDVDALNDSALNSKVIVSATESTIVGTASYDLVDSATNALGQNSTVDFYNNDGDTIVGKTYYGYKATHVSGTGIVLDYGLTQIESTHTDLLVEIDPTGSHDKTLSAKLSGAGAGFAFSGTEQITLAQQATYTGQTQLINSATLKAGVANVIASSTKVTINASTAFDLGGYDQTLQNVSGAGDIRLGDKTLAIANTETGLEFSGTIDGTGNLALNAAGEWTLTANNTYTGTTTIGAGAHLQLGTGAGGSTTGMIADASTVANSGTLTINRSDDLVYGGAVIGAGILVQRGAGTTTLTGANNIAGGIVVEQGALQIGRDDTSGWDGGVIAANVSVADATTLIFNRSDLVTYTGVISGSGNVSTIGGGTVALTKAQIHTGETRVGANSTLRTGTTNAIQASSRVFLDGALDMHNHAQQIKNLTGNAGRIHYSTNNGLATTYTNLTITGTLEGTTTSHMNVDLANKNTDMLIVQGASSLATGTHYVEFTQTNLDPIDDATRTYALKVVDYVDGDPVFTSNIVESGMFTFQLYKGDGGLIMPDDTAFYLSGGDALSRAADAILFTAGIMGPSWHFDLDSVHKRLGDIYAHRDRDTKDKDEGSVWMRVNNYRLNASSELGGSAFEQDSYGVTAGADKLLRRETATIALGGFIGISRQDRTFDDVRNQYGDGSSNTVGAGLYALWMNEQNWFVDAVLRFDRTSNKLNARGVDGFVSRGKYTNYTQGASVEFGRRLVRPSIQTSSGKLLTFWTEPLAQVAVAWINGADYTVSNGVSRDLEVRVGDSDAWQYRLQVRTGANYGQWMPYLKFGSVKTDTNGGEVTVDDREYQPWFDGWRVELGLGVGYQINDNGQLYFDYEYNKAQRYERPWAVNLGYRRAW